MPLFHPSPPADPTLTNHLGTTSTSCFLLPFLFTHVHRFLHMIKAVLVTN